MRKEGEQDHQLVLIIKLAVGAAETTQRQNARKPRIGHLRLVPESRRTDHVIILWRRRT